jgi:glycosyltransferase involved in cell wall biosynthesis
VRVVHVITDLRIGGAQLMLVRLVNALNGCGVHSDVVALGRDDGLAEELQRAGADVECLGLGRRPPDPFVLRRLANAVGRRHPDVIQSWMYHADLLTTLAAPRVKPTPTVVWGIRQTDLTLNKPATRLVARWCARLSHRRPAAVVCCSESARDAHVAFGYDPRPMTVIVNGFDLERFRPDPEARVALRRELGLSPTTPVVTMAARWDPVKDHASFLHAASIVRGEVGDAHFLLCGPGVDGENRDLHTSVAGAGLVTRAHLLGPRRDIAGVLAASDVVVSASRAEGFPNSIGEAMACAVPCVVTDVGDSRALVGSTGVVVPPADPAALGAGMVSLLRRPAEERAALGCEARQRIEQHYGIRGAAEAYARLYAKVAGPCAA